MKVAFLSDFHLGVKSGTPREQDSFSQAREAVEKALDLGAEILLISGDIFDSRIPEQEVLSDAMKILTLASEKENENIKLDRTIEKDRSQITALPLRGVPVVAIHGNHERRGRGFVDTVEALESAGLVIKLHHNAILFETPDGKLAIHGMGYVPEEYAIDVLKKWKPEPVEGAKNVFMIHQGLGRFSFGLGDESVLTPSDIPDGFDLYVSGHIHYQAESEIHGKPLIFPGSTIRTQLLPVEAKKPKGFYIADIDSEGISFDFVELDSVRDFFYEEIEFEKALPSEVENKIHKKLEEISKKQRRNKNKIPIVRLRIIGTLARGSSRSEINVSGIRSAYEDEFLLNMTYDDLSSPELKEKTQFLKDIRKEKISMEERGMKILESNLEDLEYDGSIDPRRLFELLSEDKVDEAYEEVFDKIEKVEDSNSGV